MADNMSITEVLAAFSDYDQRITGIGAKALDLTIEYLTESIWPAVDALLESDEEWTSVKASVLNDRGAKAARKAKLRWTMTEQKLAASLSVRKLHTAESLVNYSAWAATESVRTGVRSTVQVTMPNYRKWLSEVAAKYRDADGKVTSTGKVHFDKLESDAKAMATAVVDMGDVDWKRDLSGTDEQKLETVKRYIANLRVLEAELAEKVGAKAASKVSTKVTNARKAAAGIA